MPVKFVNLKKIAELIKHKKNSFKKMRIMFSAGQYQSTEKGYE